jgi:hypothetical protein
MDSLFNTGNVDRDIRTSTDTVEVFDSAALGALNSAMEPLVDGVDIDQVVTVLVDKCPLVANDVVVEDLDAFILSPSVQVDLVVLDVEAESLVLATTFDRLPTTCGDAIAKHPCVLTDRLLLTEVCGHLPQ